MDKDLSLDIAKGPKELQLSSAAEPGRTTSTKQSLCFLGACKVYERVYTLAVQKACRFW